MGICQDGVASCCSAIQEAVVERYGSAVDVVSSSDTPMNVLDLQLFSTSESGATTGTSPASATAGPERLLKRRRMGESISKQTVQISDS